jgi:hypothetical protein
MQGLVEKRLRSDDRLQPAQRCVEGCPDRLLGAIFTHLPAQFVLARVAPVNWAWYMVIRTQRKGIEVLDGDPDSDEDRVTPIIMEYGHRLRILRANGLSKWKLNLCPRLQHLVTDRDTYACLMRMSAGNGSADKRQIALEVSGGPVDLKLVAASGFTLGPILTCHYPMSGELCNQEAIRQLDMECPEQKAGISVLDTIAAMLRRGQLSRLILRFADRALEHALSSLFQPPFQEQRHLRAFGLRQCLPRSSLMNRHYELEDMKEERRKMANEEIVKCATMTAQMLTIVHTHCPVLQEIRLSGIVMFETSLGLFNQWRMLDTLALENIVLEPTPGTADTQNRSPLDFRCIVQPLELFYWKVPRLCVYSRHLPMANLPTQVVHYILDTPLELSIPLHPPTEKKQQHHSYASCRSFSLLHPLDEEQSPTELMAFLPNVQYLHYVASYRSSHNLLWDALHPRLRSLSWLNIEELSGRTDEQKKKLEQWTNDNAVLQLETLGVDYHSLPSHTALDEIILVLTQLVQSKTFPRLERLELHRFEEDSVADLKPIQNALWAIQPSLVICYCEPTELDCFTVR